MFTVSESMIIERSPTQVFNTAADPDQQLVWDSGMLKSVEKLTPGPLGPGTRYRGDFKGFGVVEYEFSEFEPDRRFAHHALMKFGDTRHIFEFETVPEGTRFTQSLIVQPKGIAKIVAPLMKPIIKRRLHTIAVEIKSYFETEGR